MSYLQSDVNVQNFLKRAQELSDKRAREDQLRTLQLEQEIEQMTSPQRRRRMPSPARRTQKGVQDDAFRASLPVRLDPPRLEPPVEPLSFTQSYGGAPVNYDGENRSYGSRSPEGQTPIGRSNTVSSSKNVHDLVNPNNADLLRDLAQLSDSYTSTREGSVRDRPGYMEHTTSQRTIRAGPLPADKKPPLHPFNVTPDDVESLATTSYDEFSQSLRYSNVVQSHSLGRKTTMRADPVFDVRPDDVSHRSRTPSRSDSQNLTRNSDSSFSIQLVNPVAREEAKRVPPTKPKPRHFSVSEKTRGNGAASHKRDDEPSREGEPKTKAQLMEEYKRERAELDAKYLGVTEADDTKPHTVEKPPKRPVDKPSKPQPVETDQDTLGSAAAINLPRSNSSFTSFSNGPAPMPNRAQAMYASSAARAPPLKLVQLSYENPLHKVVESTPQKITPSDRGLLESLSTSKSMYDFDSLVPMPNRAQAIFASAAARAPPLKLEVHTTLGEQTSYKSLNHEYSHRLPSTSATPKTPASSGSAPPAVIKAFNPTDKVTGAPWLSSAMNNKNVEHEEMDETVVKKFVPLKPAKPTSLSAKVEIEAKENYERLRQGLRSPERLHRSPSISEGPVSPLVLKKVRESRDAGERKVSLPEALKQRQFLKPAVPILKPSVEEPEAFQRHQSLKPAPPVARKEAAVPEAIERANKLKAAKPVVKPKPDLPEAFKVMEKLRPASPTKKTEEEVPEALTKLRGLKRLPKKTTEELVGTKEAPIEGIRLPCLANVDWKAQLKARTYNPSTPKLVLDELFVRVPPVRSSTLPTASSEVIVGVRRASSSGELKKQAPRLTHMTKSRTKGPKRRLPAGIEAKVETMKKVPPAVKPKPKVVPSRSFTGEFFV
ncbi:hypothetical protein BABINDRAFT_162620 [Babjeviella inositovora NRRL Y-12698]|uniref:Uncharacterized protein n=1 Tax=Babjeviella inositovora NRRL Y-12698 TaxID=984486 RepID=A0A1E3QL19_9ASCO|nr:uncharacterized protein BABINDRAFT_162620 [Babjeviella inositovora NRRL Y-12698]ODQ78383.1 hypothetical protein BABINDRAFT_162620 [Babjeviella inositovora NRRL Y-12698]